MGLNSSDCNFFPLVLVFEWWIQCPVLRTKRKTEVHCSARMLTLETPRHVKDVISADCHRNSMSVRNYGG